MLFEKTFIPKRLFSSYLGILQRQNPAITQAYINLFAHPCFDPIRNHIPVTFENMDPYTVSQKVGESLKSISSVTREQSALIHNKLIEDLSQYEYGIASIHSRHLKDINKSVSNEALIAMLKYNPGRVNSSWELFIKHMDIYEKYIPDDVLLTVLHKVVYFDPVDVKDGKKTLDLFDLIHSILIINKIQNFQKISNEMIEKLVSSCIDLKATFLLPYLFKFSPQMDLFVKKLYDLTSYQLFLIWKHFSFEDIMSYKELMYRLVSTFGKNEKIVITDEEKAAYINIRKQLDIVKGQLIADHDLEINAIETFSTSDSFEKLLEQIVSVELHKTDIKLAKSILRSIGVFKNDTRSFLELYHICVSAFPGKEEELFFEAFLSLTYQGYKTSNETALQFAEAYIPETATDLTRTKILCVQILANAKFNIDESLNIYNDNIQKLNRGKDEVTNLSQADAVTESLILAYLSNRDLDFARVIFEGAANGELLSGPTAIKRIKGWLSMYGEAVENGDVDATMENQIKLYLQNI